MSAHDKIFADRIKEVNGETDLRAGLDPLTILGLPVLQKDGTVEWSMPKTDEETADE